jgi:predicted nucleotidyltransferase component of viral defense system
MRTISDEQLQLINDALAEGASTLSAAALEKDVLLTEALRAISEIKLPGLALTFAGGTCLSKAYGLLERMSEDIDLRLAAALVAAMRAAKFELVDKDIRARN